MTLSLNQSKTAILALDFVNDIVHPDGKFAARGVPAILAQAGTIGHTKGLLEAARGKCLAVIHVARRHRAGYLDQPSYTQLDQRVKGFHALLEGSWGAEFCDELKPEQGDVVIIKRRVDAFHGYGPRPYPPGQRN
jgi:nicotinamidase-related amidase